eukprot:jgi/Ulvmu1/1542/UM110_0005.1
MDCVWLERTESGLVAELAEGERLHLPQSVLEGSVPLSTAYGSSEAADRTKLQLSPESVRAWQAFRLRPDKPHDVETLMLVAEAAVYLGDDGALHALRLVLATHLSNSIQRALDAERSPAGVCVPASAEESDSSAEESIPTELCEQVTARLEGHALTQATIHRVLEVLPEWDAVHVLCAALARLPARHHNGYSRSRVSLHFSSSHGSSLRVAAMDAAMGILPQHLWPLVLCAVDPAADKSGRLTLSHAPLHATDRIMRAAAGLQGAGIHTLALYEMQVLGEPAPQMGRLAPSSPGQVREHAYRALKPLASMASLIDFSLVAGGKPGVPGAEGPVWKDALDTALCSVLPAVPQLTRLCLSCIHSSTDAGLKCLSALRMLRMLCELDLCGTDIGRDFGAGAPVHALAGALATLGALTNLDLSHTNIQSCGWAVIRDALCSSSVSLRALNLQNCNINGAFRILPPADVAVALPKGAILPVIPPSLTSDAMAGLQSLSLGVNSVSADVLCAALACLPCLTSLHMPDVSVSKGGYESFTAQLLSALSHSGAPRLQELLWLVPNNVSKSGVRRLLAACCELRVLCIILTFSGREGYSNLPTGDNDLLPQTTPPGLQSLDLPKIAAADVSALSAALGTCTGLTSLKITWAGDDTYDAASSYAEEMLTRLAALQSLHLRSTGTRCSKDLLAALARGLLPLTRLTSMLLFGMPVFGAVLPTLAQALSGMHALRRLELRGFAEARPVNGRHIDDLLTVLTSMSALRVLSVCSTNEPPDYAEKWAAVLPQLSQLEDLQLDVSHTCPDLMWLVAAGASSLRCLRLARAYA